MYAKLSQLPTSDRDGNLPRDTVRLQRTRPVSHPLQQDTLHTLTLREEAAAVLFERPRAMATTAAVLPRQPATSQQHKAKVVGNVGSVYSPWGSGSLWYAWEKKRLNFAGFALYCWRAQDQSGLHIWGLYVYTHLRLHALLKNVKFCLIYRVKIMHACMLFI